MPSPKKRPGLADVRRLMLRPAPPSAPRPEQPFDPARPPARYAKGHHFAINEERPDVSELLRSARERELQPNGRDTDVLLEQLVAQALESEGAGRARPVVTPELRAEWGRFEAAVAAAIEELCQQHPPADGEAEDWEVFETDGPLLVLMTLRGEGIGIWDGSWSAFWDDDEIKSHVEPFLERRLRSFADSSGAGSLEDAIQDAAETSLHGVEPPDHAAVRGLLDRTRHGSVLMTNRRRSR